MLVLYTKAWHSNARIFKFDDSLIAELFSEKVWVWNSWYMTKMRTANNVHSLLGFWPTKCERQTVYAVYSAIYKEEDEGEYK